MDNSDLISIINPIRNACEGLQSSVDTLVNSLKDAEIAKKNELSDINVEMDKFLKMVYSEFAEKRQAVEAKFANNTAVIRNNLAENKKKLLAYEKAIENLIGSNSNHKASQPTRANVSTSSEDGDIPSETIYDTVIHILYNNLSSGLTYENISQILISRGMIPSHKNPVNVCANVIGILKSKGYIDKVNDRYMLTDSQEADYRRKLSRIVFSILSKEFYGKAATLKEVVACLRTKMDKRHLPDDINRRVRGILIGMKLQDHVIKNYENGQECFAVQLKNSPEPALEQENTCSP